MTINADFFKIIKEDCGNAFSEDAPAKPDVVFIDGQVKLMKAAQVDSWGLFFAIQFFKTIENCFALGASTVVLGFDDYRHVPASKNMTQVKRSKQKIVLAFSDTSTLPSKMPEDWGGAMANRSFKIKVITKVLEVTEAWFKKKLASDFAYRERNLVLDYAGVPKLIHLGVSDVVHPIQHFINEHEWVPQNNTVGRGECDIKAFVWMNVSKLLCIVSTDGDYLPLALLQTHENFKSGRSKTCNVILYRMTTQTRVEKSTIPAKRKLAGTCENKTKTPRKYEYVDIACIAVWLKKVMPSKATDPVLHFCVLVALCGCDFARNLPRLGPRTLWKLRHMLSHIDLLQISQIMSALSIAYSDLYVMKKHNASRY